jgi:uncharacterized protein YcsI (UPF0317 family)
MIETSAADVRAACRAGRWTGPTSGAAPGHMQVNLAIVPRACADDFRRFCDANPKPCPLLAVSAPGEPRFPSLGADIDLRTDLPGYRVWQNGTAMEVADATEHWRDDLVAFALGCSFGFEAALTEAGFALPHVTAGRNVAMYDTQVPLTPAGPFGGNMVVSMRFIPEHRLAEAVAISGRFPQCHGAPVHVGDPSDIGIAALARPEYGDPPEGDGVPVFWACGVTPQAALRRAGLPFAITHSPGRMLVCDVPATWDKILNAPP